jgi:hypothetical protein
VMLLGIGLVMVGPTYAGVFPTITRVKSGARGSASHARGVPGHGSPASSDALFALHTQGVPSGPTDQGTRSSSPHARGPACCTREVQSQCSASHVRGCP